MNSYIKDIPIAAKARLTKTHCNPKPEVAIRN